MPRTWLICILLCINASRCQAQWAFGVLAGIDDDATWGGTLSRFGICVERPPVEGALWRLRASVFHQPEREEASGGSGYDQAAGVTRTEYRTRRLQSTGLTLAIKWPFGCEYCPHGLYRGFYVLTGVEWAARQWKETRESGVDGVVQHTARTDRTTQRFAITGGMGGEYNFSWGCPFLEAGLNAMVATNDPEEKGVFPGSPSLVLGYRYCFRARPHAPQRRTNTD